MSATNTRLLILIAFTGFLTSCASVGFGELFKGYSERMTPVRNAVARGDINQAQSQLPEQSASHNEYLLNLLERGRLAFLEKQTQSSNSVFETAYQGIEEQQQAAKVQISSGLQQGSALLTNDSVITYEPSDFEQTMLLSYKALNYLFEKNTEAALVEVRRANQVQIRAAKKSGEEIDQRVSKAASQYPSMDSLIGDVKSGYENAFSYYLSGLIYQSQGQIDDAYIDYKKALAIFPNNPSLQRDVQRLAKRGGFNDELAQWQRKYGEVADVAANQGELIILAEQGLIPAMQSASLSLPIFSSRGDTRFYSFSLPVYRNTPYQPNVTSVSVNGQSQPLTPLIELESLAAKTLKDSMPGRLTRQLLRIYAKEKVRAELTRSGGDVGNIVANIYNIASEKADTRSWQTLPNQIDLLRLAVSAGKHQVTVSGLGEPIEVNVVQRGFTLVYLTLMNNRLQAEVVQL